MSAPAAKASSSSSKQQQRKDSIDDDDDAEEVTAEQLEALHIEAVANAPGEKNKKKKKKNKKKSQQQQSIVSASTSQEQDDDGDEQQQQQQSYIDDDDQKGDSEAAPASSSSAAPAEEEEEESAGSSEEDDESLIMHTLGGKVIHMHREPWGLWSMTDYAAIKVRSVDYVTSGVKIPPPCPPTMEIVHLEIYQAPQQIHHVCQYQSNWLRQYKASIAAKSSSASVAASASSSSSAGKKKTLAKSSSSASSSPSPSASPEPDLSSGVGLRPFDDDFFFVVTFHVQNDPTYHLTMYFQRRDVARRDAKKNGFKVTKSEDEEQHDPEEAAQAKTAFDTLFERFITGTTEFRNNRLKLIPYVVDGGGWLVTRAVGNRPAIIGNRITTKYHCNAELNYMEVNIDVSGSNIGSGIFRVVKGYAAYLTLDLTLLLEGQEDDELPEVILGGCRLRHVDMSQAEMRVPPTH